MYVFRLLDFRQDPLFKISVCQVISSVCFPKVLVPFFIILFSEMIPQKYKFAVAIRFTYKPDMQVLRRLAQNREAARKSRLRKKVFLTFFKFSYATFLTTLTFPYRIKQFGVLINLLNSQVYICYLGLCSTVRK